MPVRKRIPQDKAVQEQPQFTEQEIQELHDLLLSERERLQKRLNISGNHLDNQERALDKQEDVGGDHFMRETNLKLMSDDRRRLELITDALFNLAHGKYGICQECGKRIRIGRLRAKPYAKYCISCKTKREKSGLSEQEF